MKEDVKEVLEDTINRFTSGQMKSNQLNKMIFKYEHDFDYIYGNRVGYVLGLVCGYYVGKYGTNPPEEELLEISEAIQLRINDIKNNIKK